MTSNVDTQPSAQLVPSLKESNQQVEALYQAASGAVGLQQYGQAIGIYDQALSFAQQIGNIEEAAWSLDRIATVYCYNLGNVQQGIAYYKQALKAAEQTGDDALISMYWIELGAAYSQSEQYEQAIECYNQALNLARSADDKTREGGSLSDLGSAYQAQGKLKEAVTFYRKAF